MPSLVVALRRFSSWWVVEEEGLLIFRIGKNNRRRKGNERERVNCFLRSVVEFHTVSMSSVDCQ